MKNAFTLLVVVAFLFFVGCATFGKTNEQLQSRGDLIGELMGTVPVKVPLRPPVFPGHAALDHAAPFSDSAYTMKVWNRVRLNGNANRTAITKVWIAGVPTPIWEHFFQVPWLNYDRAIAVETPSCQFVSGDGECWITVQAEVWSVRRDLNGNAIPSRKLYCVRSDARAMTENVYLEAFEKAECPVTDAIITAAARQQ